ncbi:hemicentin-1 isoform X13 [Cephus cinctus]|uniref:Hemicentin-1 isoform X13 n=1 Tax=Cephus cinctus TaxID=211228 RepID=A0AAJ7W5A0_CEPCN|nr:hemicentin-1 isoform X13 [Cephus cinctus]
MDPMVIFLLVLAAIVRAPEVNGSTKPWIHTEELSAERGTEVILPCHLKLPECGGLHSVKWYHNSTRILMFSESAGLTRTANDIATKAEIINEANATTILLKIPNIKLTYEGLYKCEPTYAAVNRECNYMQQIALTVTVRPKYVRVIDEVSKSTLPSGTSLGPINEGDKIILNCESDKGRPVPEVEWYRDDQRLEATSTSKVDENGIGARSSKLQMQITRKELGAVFTCKTSSPALKEPLTVEINLNVHVPPLAMDLTGFVDHVVQGTNIVLECTASEAKPPANVTWYNGTTVLTKDNDRLEMLRTEYNLSADGTSKTTSYLLFTASAYDDDKTFKCLTENNITRLQSPRRLEKTTTITVHYPPIVKLNPKNITVNETEDFLMFCNYRANPSSLKKITWLRDGEELQLKGDHYDGGITEQTALKVKNSTPSDMGIYTCILENSVGKSTTQDFIDVSVLHRPTVAVTTEPKVPVNEEDHLNVSLTCEVIAGYPTTLTAVRWYLDGDLLKELPDCASNSTTPTSDGDVEDSATFCDIDPSKLLLEAVGRSFHGNYSCEGRTDAGWGPVSASTPVAVYYKPGPATISYEPQQVIRKGPLRINCLVADPGRPEVTGYRWTRGSSRLPNEKNSVLNIKSVNLTIEANFTCLAYNEAGEGEPASTFINVWAAPAFIKKLPSYHGSPYNSPNVSIECWVECDPMCNISWMKNGVPMDFSNDNRYYLQEFRHPPNPNTNDFESIQSILIWKLTEWPGHHLNEFEDNGNFTCVSSGNSIGPGVNSSTLFKVDFPPVNMTITKSVVDVVVDRIPEVVECGATAHPTPTFRWYRNDSSDIFSQTHIFALKTPVPQRSTGTYICEAKNQLGSNTISFFMNVQFKPKCTIEKHHINSKEYVVCSATANPKECNFTWSLKNENETLEQVGEDRDDGNSYLLLDSSVSNTRIYVCVANNSIGFSDACELRVDAHNGNNSNVGWWSRLDDDLKIIVIIVASVIVLVMVIICIVVFLIFRRKRNQVKYPNQAANNNHVDSVSERLPEPETKTFYENLPFHGIQTPPNKTNSLYNYQEHYQQHQEMQQYGYPIASSSSSQLTLPLTRSLHHSSVVSPLQPSFTQTNNHRHSLMGNRLLNDGSTTLPPLSLVQSEMEDIHHHQQIDQQQQHHQQNSSNGRRRQERRKYRNKHDRHDRKVKRRSRSDNNATNITSITTNTTTSNHHHQSAVSAGNSGPYGFSRETSFNQVQDLGIPESYKILYPHYYEDAITECPTDYPVRNPTPPRDNSNRMINHQTPLHYAELNLAKSRKGKRYSALRDTRPPSAPPSSTQYAELHFRDVGQEIDV